MRKLMIAILLAVMGGSAVLAQTPAPGPTPEQEAVSMQAWGVSHPTCLEWTDVCTVCTRAASGAPQCSTPGIACLPSAPVCLNPKAPQP